MTKLDLFKEMIENAEDDDQADALASVAAKMFSK